MREQRGVKHRGVVVQPLTEFARWELGGVGDLLALPAEVEATAQPWQAAPAVRQAHGQVETFEDPAVDHPGDADRRLHRIADELGEPVIALAVGVGDPTGVDEDEHVALRQQGPKVVVHRVIELFATSASADGDARETQFVEAA